MGKIYAGVSNTAREIKSIYAGVNGVAKSISKVYAGVNGVAELIWQNAILPSAYQQVEYLLGTGTQYINTGVYITANSLAIQIDFQLTSNEYDPGAVLMGGMGINNMRFYISCIRKTEAASKAKHIDIGCGGGWWTDSSVADLNRHTYKTDMKNKKVYKDGVSKSRSGGTYSGGTSSSTWIGIFCGSNANGEMTYSPPKGYCYNAKIWQNDTLIHNYYPCYRKSDNEPGLYDMVGNAFLSNAGSGTFTAGPNYIGEL